MAGVYKTPSLIFYRAGEQIGALPKVRDWSDYMARIAQILAARPNPPTPETKEAQTMPSDFRLPPVGFGPGSQPSAADGEELSYMAMPKDMAVYVPHTPEVDDPEAVAPALACSCAT
jgi:hypothetical protein